MPFCSLFQTSSSNVLSEHENSLEYCSLSRSRKLKGLKSRTEAELGSVWIMSALEQEVKVIKNKLIEVCYVVRNKKARGN